MFKIYRIGRSGGGVILYIYYRKYSEIKLERDADCYEAVCCYIVTGISTLTTGLVYRSPNINK